jgi:hypothetical protein
VSRNVHRRVVREGHGSLRAGIRSSEAGVHSSIRQGRSEETGTDRGLWACTRLIIDRRDLPTNRASNVDSIRSSFRAIRRVECRFLGRKAPSVAFTSGGHDECPGRSEPCRAETALNGVSGNGVASRAHGSPPYRRALNRRPGEGEKPVVKRDDNKLFFVEMVPKRYTFGTGTPPKWLDLV